MDKKEQRTNTYGTTLKTPIWCPEPHCGSRLAVVKTREAARTMIKPTRRVRMFSSGFEFCCRGPEPVTRQGKHNFHHSNVLNRQTPCLALERRIELDAPRSEYRRGWVPNAGDLAKIMASWTITVQDLNDSPVSLKFWCDWQKLTHHLGEWFTKE